MEKLSPDDNSVASFDLIRHQRANGSIFLHAFDLIELNGDDLRRDPLEVRKATLASIVALKALCQSARIPLTAPAARPTGSK
jgi:ATP-dependent DNA ligase